MEINIKEIVDKAQKKYDEFTNDNTLHDDAADYEWDEVYYFEQELQCVINDIKKEIEQTADKKIGWT